MKYLYRILKRIFVVVYATIMYMFSGIIWILHMLWEFKFIPWKWNSYWYMDYEYQETVEGSIYWVGASPKDYKWYTVTHCWKTAYHYAIGCKPEIRDSRDED